MNYILTENKTVLLGPISWKPRFLQSELDDLEVDYKISPIEGYTKINDELEIFPITSAFAPDHDSNFETISGPYYTFTDTEASQIYTKIDLDINSIKYNLKSIVTDYRYKIENDGTKITIQDLEVTIDTARGNRDIFVQKFLLMNDTDIVEWKFPEGWLTLSKHELGSVVAAGNDCIQNAFVAEKLKNDEIDACDTIIQLKLVVLPKDEIAILGV